MNIQISPFPPENVLTPDQGGTGLSLRGIAANFYLVSDGADGWVLTAVSAASVTATNVVTLTNKRITGRCVTVAANANPTYNTDNADEIYITGQNAAIASMTTNATGAPAVGDFFVVNITDNGTARAITWGANFEASGTIPLPTTTVISTLLTVSFHWNAVTSKWRCVGVA